MPADREAKLLLPSPTALGPPLVAAVASGGADLLSQGVEEPPAVTRTLIEFHGANCSWCLNNMLTHLRSHESVVSVSYHAGTGCIEVDHDADDAADLLAGIQEDLRGWRQADNGERMMVDLDVHPAEACPFEPRAGS